MKRPTCETCRFWDGPETDSDGEEVGSCHRRPPSIIEGQIPDRDRAWHNQFIAVFPETRSSEWCGEWTPQ